MDGNLPRLIGHRGAAGSAPENTLAGFTRAAALGVTWVELDVQLTSDHVPVVFHDDRLERTTGGRGLLVEASWAEIRDLDAGSWFAPRYGGERIPTLAQALECIAGHGLCVNIEIKADEARGRRTCEAALAVAAEAWPAGRPAPMISSFARSAMSEAADRMPEWPRGLLLEGWPADWLPAARDLRCVSLNVDHRRLGARRAAAVKAAGLDLLAYTVNTPARAERLWGWGVDAVFTDWPERLLQAGRPQSDFPRPKQSL